MFACGDRETCRRSQYSGTAGLRLCRRLPGVALIAAVVGALAVSGCSYRLASLVSQDDTDAMPTGSITRPADRAVPVAFPSGPRQWTSLMRAQPPRMCLPAAAKTQAWLGEIHKAAPAATSRRSTPPTAKTAIRAAISSPATCMGWPRIGSKARRAGARAGLGK